MQNRQKSAVFVFLVKGFDSKKTKTARIITAPNPALTRPFVHRTAMPTLFLAPFYSPALIYGIKEAFILLLNFSSANL